MRAKITFKDMYLLELYLRKQRSQKVGREGKEEVIFTEIPTNYFYGDLIVVVLI